MPPRPEYLQPPAGVYQPGWLDERLWGMRFVATRLADRERGWLIRAYRSAHPAVVRSFWEQYGQEPTRMRITLSPDAIDEFDQCMDWIIQVPSLEDRTILLARGAGHAPWRAIAMRLGLDPRTVKARHRRALDKLCRMLNSGEAR